MQPKVSILIPLFNSEKYITETLKSAINQTWSNKEIIIVDDGSTDNSHNIAKSFESDILKVYKQNNKGACATRNKLFELSSGDYIQYLDADDLLSNDKIEKQITGLKETPDKLALCESWHFSENIKNAYIGTNQILFSTDDPPQFLCNLWGANYRPFFIGHHAFLTHRNLIKLSGNWNETILSDQDGEYFTRVILNSKGIIFIPNIKCYYRFHSSGKNISAQKGKEQFASKLIVIRLKQDYLFRFNNSIQARRAIAVQYKYLAIDSWPDFKDISNLSMKECKKLGYIKYAPKMGGYLVEIIKFIFGWKMAKIFSKFIRKVAINFN